MRRASETTGDDAVRRIDSMPYAEAANVMLRLVAKSDPTLGDILAVEKVLGESVDVASKGELAGMIGGSISRSKLDTILARLVMESKVMFNGDGSISWIYSGDNPRLLESWTKSAPA